LYEYQASLFKDSKLDIFISLPKNFKLSKFDKEKFKELGIKPLFVPENLSLGEAIVYCINILNVERNLFILHGDTYFKTLDFSPNCLHLAKAKENYAWSFLDDGFEISNPIKHKQDFILAGAFNIDNPRLLVKETVENEYDFIQGLKSYSKTQAFKIALNNTWLDFGLITNYFHSKKIIGTQRSFNELSIQNLTILKSSKWHKKIQAEIFWFENLPQALQIYTPKFQAQKDSYLLEYLYNNTLAELFVFGNLPDFIWKRIFLCLKEFLSSLHSFKTSKKLNFDYKSKTLQRLQTFSKENNFDLKSKLIINGKEKLSILELLKSLEKFTPNPKEYSLIHGDFCFSNIMFDFRADSIKTFDPRGLDFDENITNYGDLNYDLAKLAHSVLGFYDFIIAGFFKAKITKNSISFSLQQDEQTKAIQKSFKEVFKPSKQIYAVMIHLFLSMLPLHNDNKNRQIAFLANAYRLWDEFFKEQK